MVKFMSCKTIVALGLVLTVLAMSVQGMAGDPGFPSGTITSVNGDSTNVFTTGDDQNVVVNWATNNAYRSKVVLEKGSTTLSTPYCYSSSCSYAFSKSNFNGEETWSMTLWIYGSEPLDLQYTLVIQDTTKPVITSVSTEDGHPYSGQFMISFTATDYNDLSYEINIDHSDLSGDTHVYQSFFLWDTTVHPDQSSHTITYKATDEYGNVETVVHTVWIDQTAPVVTITSPTNGNTYYDLLGVSWTVDDVTYDYSKVKVDGFVWVTTSGTSCVLEGLNQGWHTITVTAYDLAGNSGSDSVTIYLKVRFGGIW